MLAAGQGDGSGIAHAAGDVLTALAQVIPDTPASAAMREQLAGVTEVYDRGRAHPPGGPTGRVGQRGAGVADRGLATRRGPGVVGARRGRDGGGDAGGCAGRVGRGSRRLPSGPRPPCPSPRRAPSPQRAGRFPTCGHPACPRPDVATTRRATRSAPAPQAGCRHPGPSPRHHQWVGFDPTAAGTTATTGGGTGT